MAENDERELMRRLSEEYGQVGPPDDRARARLLEAVRREPPRRRRGLLRGGWDRPGLRGWLATAAAVLLLFLGGATGWTLRGRWPTGSETGAADELARLQATSEVRLIQFVVAAPRASRVAVVGSFNDWDPSATPMHRQESGAWVTAIPLPPGRHVYAFILDGERWMPDPAAPLAPEDGFGIRNSVIVVAGSEST